LAGKSDWRLPDVKELTSIVDYRVNNPSIDDAFFPGTSQSFHWSASSSSSDSDFAWYVEFQSGGVKIDLKTETGVFFLRCVR